MREESAERGQARGERCAAQGAADRVCVCVKSEEEIQKMCTKEGLTELQ